MDNQKKSPNTTMIFIVVLIIAALIVVAIWWLISNSTTETPTPISNDNTNQSSLNEDIDFSGITPLSLGMGAWETEYGFTVFDYGYEWQEGGLFLQFGFSINVCEKIKKISATRDTGKREISSLSITITETNSQETTGNYCDGIQSYIFEGIIEDMPQGTYPLSIQTSNYGTIEYGGEKKITTPLKLYQNVLGTPQDLTYPTINPTNINLNANTTTTYQDSNCSQNSDCVLAYTGDSTCAPCHNWSKNYHCVSPKEAKELEQNRIDYLESIEPGTAVLCARCNDSPFLFYCKCDNSVCVKTAECNSNSDCVTDKYPAGEYVCKNGLCTYNSSSWNQEK
ncbi:hypothetical protein KKF61_01670 [Patescibacteria group bacterium]|nr:hypothetical protein [Patescibacteria group bacterium]